MESHYELESIARAIPRKFLSLRAEEQGEAQLLRGVYSNHRAVHPGRGAVDDGDRMYSEPMESPDLLTDHTRLHLQRLGLQRRLP